MLTIGHGLTNPIMTSIRHDASFGVSSGSRAKNANSPQGVHLYLTAQTYKQPVGTLFARLYSFYAPNKHQLES